MMMKLLYGGTFDPIHEGHLYWAEQIRQLSGVPQVAMVPCARPAHRAEPGASDAQRVAMLQLALNEYPHLRVEDCELQSSGLSYTVQTLRHLSVREPQSCWAWIMGMDSFVSLPLWREPEALARMVRFIVIPRAMSKSDLHEVDSQQIESMPLFWRQQWRARKPLSAAALQASQSADVLIAQGDSLPYSATAIRVALRERRSSVPGLPKVVRDYIDEQGLYCQ